ncbi:MAG: DUF885 domain-containing protein [Myxococcota bacterium]
MNRVSLGVIFATATVACAPSNVSKPAPTSPSPRPAAAEVFDRFAESYIDWYLQEHPAHATYLGVHDYDAFSTKHTAEAYEARKQQLSQWLTKLNAIDRSTLKGDRFFDHRILEYQLRSRLLSIAEIEYWRKDPRVYSNAALIGVAPLVDRRFAPLTERLKSITARLKAFGAIFAAAQRNLSAVPPLWAKLATNSTRGAVTYLESSLPQALKAEGFDQLAPSIRAPFEQARTEALQATQAYLEWMTTDLAKNADGDFRLGKELFEKKLRFEEHVDLTCEQLKDQNERAIAFYQKWVARTAKRIDPEASSKAVMASITEDFPPPAALISTATKLVADAQTFVQEKQIIPLPTDLLPTVRPTPAYRRLSFGSMSAPGPFETKATEAYYNITNVDPTWDEERQKQHMTYFNYPGLLGISVHEAVPGHYTHSLYRRQSPSRVRKIFVPRSLTEGWAHYVEQMMVDEGFGDGDPKVRLGQLRRALQRHARWYAGVAMHCFGTPLEEAAKRYQEIAYFAAFPALREVQRGTSDATYLYYALGRMEILRIRQLERDRRGQAFNLGRFHQALLAQGLPLPLFEAYLKSSP